MKLIVTHLFLLLVLVTAVSGQASSSVKGRAMAQLEQWASVQAHCAEASNTQGEINYEAALECKKCQAGVGDWNTPDGFQRGKACLETWEPKTLEVCGDLFQQYEDSGYDASNVEKMVECWENTYRRAMAAKCLEATGGEDMNLALLCVSKHLTDNHKHTEKVLFGSSDEDPMKPSKMELVVQSIFNEGRCLHANEGNTNRIQECTLCFNHVHMNEKKLSMKRNILRRAGELAPCGESALMSTWLQSTATALRTFTSSSRPTWLSGPRRSSGRNRRRWRPACSSNSLSIITRTVLLLVERAWTAS